MPENRSKQDHGALIPKAQRWSVLLQLAEKEIYLDVLNRYAVDQYVLATNADVLVMPYGANKCRRMGQDLSEMASAGLLKRHRVGIPMGGMGFPRWVWTYKLTDIGRAWRADNP